MLFLVFGAFRLAQFLTALFYLLLNYLLHYWILNICFEVQLFYGACVGLTCAPLDYWKLVHSPSLQQVHDVLKNLFKWFQKIYSSLNLAALFLYVVTSEASLWIIHISSSPILWGYLFMKAQYWVLLLWVKFYWNVVILPEKRVISRAFCL